MAPKPKGYFKSGFKKVHEFNNIYRGIDYDIDRMILEGHLIEFKDNNTLHDNIKRENSKQQRKTDHREITIIYPVNMNDTEVEVRGGQGKYSDESLDLLSKLWNTQVPNEDFEWKKIIDDNKHKLLDESEVTQYDYRMDILKSYNNTDVDNEGKQRKR